MQAAVMMMAVMTAVSCSEVQSDSADNGDGFIPVTFTMSTPAGEAVPYSATRTSHDEAEWTINKLALYVYAVDADGNGTFLRSYATDAAGEEAINIISNGAGTYTFTLRAPVSDMNARRRFVFVANDAVASVPGAGDPQANLDDAMATVTLENNATADALAVKDKGIAMTGTAQSSGSDVVTITPGVKCEVHLKRIVARVDIQNNTPNLVIKSVVLENAAPKGYLFAHNPVKAADEGYITEGMNAGVSLGSSYDEQKDLQKVFYLYERTNSEAGSAQVRITYMINNSNGSVTVPFKKTSDDMAYVDIERNTLYTIVLGNGDPIVTNKVTFTLNVEDWNAVDLDESVDPDEDEQAKMNAALKVNMFTQFNAKDVNLEENKINSFYDKLTVSTTDCPVTSYYDWNELNDAGAFASDAVFTDNYGNHYRLPTSGEAALLLPYFTEEDQRVDIDPGTKNGMRHPTWGIPESGDTQYYQIITSEFPETIYLKNTDDGKVDMSDHGADENYKIEGTSQMKLGEQVDALNFNNKVYNIHPVYAFRFKGSSQYAAYRWEQCRIADNPQERYFSIKIKALSNSDNITIDDIAQESFWKDGYIEFKFPDSGYYDSEPTEEPDNMIGRGLFGRYWASSTNEDGMQCLYGHGAGDGAVSWLDPSKNLYFSLRFVKVEE